MKDFFITIYPPMAGYDTNKVRAKSYTETSTTTDGTITFTFYGEPRAVGREAPVVGIILVPTAFGYYIRSYGEEE